MPKQTESSLSSQKIQRRYRVVTGDRWTGSPKKSIDQIGKNCPKSVRKLCFQPLQTILGDCFDNFRLFSDILSTFPFLGCPTICPLQIQGVGLLKPFPIRCQEITDPKVLDISVSRRDRKSSKWEADPGNARESLRDWSVCIDFHPQMGIGHWGIDYIILTVNMIMIHAAPHKAIFKHSYGNQSGEREREKLAKNQS